MLKNYRLSTVVRPQEGGYHSYNPSLEQEVRASWQYSDFAWNVISLAVDRKDCLGRSYSYVATQVHFYQSYVLVNAFLSLERGVRGPEFRCLIRALSENAERPKPVNQR